MTEVQILLAILVIFVVIGTWEVRQVGEKVGKRLELLEELLAAEFGREERYYREKEKSDRRFEEFMEETRGLGPVDAVPIRPEPPAVVSVAEHLRSIASSLARLVAAAESRTTTPPATQ